MKIIIGINAYHADSSACIIIDGELIAAVEEERLNRQKHYSGYPLKSIEECLKIANIKSTQITDFAFNTKPLSNLLPKTIHFIKNFELKKNYSTERYFKKISIEKLLYEKFKLSKNIKFHFIEHHLAHIASAYYPSGFNKCIGLSIDGSGDFVTCAIAKCNNNKIKIIEKINFPHSLGIFYHGMTQFLGYKNYGDEYKIMGLAAYGKPKYFQKIKDNLFKFKSDKLIELNLEFFNHHKPGYKYITGDNLKIDQICNEKLDDLFFNELNNKNNYDEFLKDFASSVQKVYEFFFNKIIAKIVSKKFSNNLVFSGGCALNSSANRYLTNNKDNFQNVYINYAPGDNGGAIGAALVVTNKYKKNNLTSKSPYLGPKFTNDEIKIILENNPYKNNISYEFYEDPKKLFEKSAKIISEGNIVGWFQDKMEFGPRALGNRSILADPRNPGMKDIINKRIKRRESFRPFAPVILKSFQDKWFESEFVNPYMSSLSLVKENKQKLIPAVTHVDGSARLQTVDKETNFKLANLIEEFYKITNVPVLLNTSFNENEPIVMKPNEALDCILRNDFDFLIMEKFLIKKKF